MAQSVKALPHKPVDLSLIFDLYMLTTACVTPVIINILSFILNFYVCEYFVHMYFEREKGRGRENIL